MPRMIIAGVAAAMTVFLLAASAQAQTPGTPETPTEKQQIALLETQSQEAYDQESWVQFYVANMKLHDLLGYESEYMANIVRACALLDRKTTAYHFMLKMQQQGMSHDFNAVEDTLNIRGTEAYEYINGMLVDAGRPSGTGMEVFTLPGSPSDYRAMAWDSNRDRLLVGTVRDGAITAVAANGESEVILEAGAENGFWSVDGLAVDTENRRLWVASGATDVYSGMTPADNNLGALFEVDLESMKVVGRYNFPEDGLKHKPGGIAITDDGYVYVINRIAPVIYGKAPDSDQLAAFFVSKDMTGFRDIAAAPDNSRIFVADAAKGIMVIDPFAQQASLLGGPENLNLGGIESIEYRNGELFVVQGGFEPQRVIRLKLDGAGMAAESVSPMVNAQEKFDRPGISTIRGEDLLYFANTGADAALEIIVMSTPLDAGSEVAPPDMAQFEEAIRAKQRQDKE